MPYIASQHTTSNKPIGIGAAVPTDARSYFYDSVNFLYRPFISVAEALAYLDTPTKRTGHFPVIVNTGGTVNGATGVLTGGTNAEYVFKDGVADANLVIKQAAATFANISGAVADNSTLTAYIAAQLSALVASAPGVLDTLDELAAALGDDPNFATTMTNALAGKVGTASIVNALTSTATNVPLSAAQGKVLKDLIDGLANVYEPKRTTQGTADNKDFGTIAGTVMEGNAIMAFKEANNTFQGDNTFQGEVNFNDVTYFNQQLRYLGLPLEDIFQPKSATPAGVFFTTPPATNPTVTDITGGKRYAETAAAISNNGTSVTIPALNVDVLNTTTGLKRIDLIVARYSGGTAGYERVAGTASAGTAVAPALPSGTILVRLVNVTDGGSAPAPTPTDTTQLDGRVTTLEAKVTDIYPEGYTALGYTASLAINTTGKRATRVKIPISGDLNITGLTNTITTRVQTVVVQIDASVAANVTIPGPWLVPQDGLHTLFVDAGKRLTFFIEVDNTTITLYHS